VFTGEGRRDEDAKGKKEEGGRRGSVKECRRRERGK